MRNYSDKPRSQRFLIVLGIALIIGGVVGLLNEYLLVGWWHVFVDNLRMLLHGALPIALIAFGAYLMWASRKGILSGALHPRSKIRLRRSRTDRRLCGVCGGFARSRQIDSIYVRIAVLLIALAFPFATTVVYFLVAVVVPAE